MAWFDRDSRIRTVIAMMAVAAIVVCTVTSRGLASVTFDAQPLVHHGHVHGGHDHPASDDAGAEHEDVGTPHVHVVGLPLPAASFATDVFRAATRATLAPAVKEALTPRLERPPKQLAC
jgi:hypothetical protein